MTRGLGLALAAVGVLVSCGGCATLMAHAQTKLGRAAPPEYEFRTAREYVDSKLGAPIERTPLPDGGYLATYKYRTRVSEPNAVGALASGIEGVSAAIDPRLTILLEPLLIPTALGAAIVRAASPTYATVMLTFGPYDDLLHPGPPTPYGPDDEALARPPIGTLRRGCWLQPGAGPPDQAPAPDRQYVECVARRLAVWGIE